MKAASMVTPDQSKTGLRASLKSKRPVYLILGSLAGIKTGSVDGVAEGTIVNVGGGDGRITSAVIVENGDGRAGAGAVVAVPLVVTVTNAAGSTVALGSGDCVIGSQATASKSNRVKIRNRMNQY